MKRVIVLGLSASGKTTFAKKISKKLSIPHIEIDAEFWGENWAEPDLDEFRKRFHKKVDQTGESWVICGNYQRSTGDYHWKLADTIIFLDIPFPLIFLRVIKRTFKRRFSNELLWGKNRETLRGALFSKKSLMAGVIKYRNKSGNRYFSAEKDPKYKNTTFKRFRSNRQAEKWLETL